MKVCLMGTFTLNVNWNKIQQNISFSLTLSTKITKTNRLNILSIYLSIYLSTKMTTTTKLLKQKIYYNTVSIILK